MWPRSRTLTSATTACITALHFRQRIVTQRPLDVADELGRLWTLG
jgi:hypothetical protein